MSRYWPGNPGPVTPLPLAVGDRVKLAGSGQRQWWTVQAVSEHFAACVQQVPFKAAPTLQYTVLDWRSGVRGPCDLIGQGYGDGTYSREQCAEMLLDFEHDPDADPARLAAEVAGEDRWAPTRCQLRVSQRNNVVLAVTAHQIARVTA